MPSFFRSLGILLCCLLTVSLFAQDSPLISGGIGWITTHSDGSTSAQPVVAPVAVVPLGDRVVIESRADVRGFLLWPNTPNGNFQANSFATLEYLQLDFIVNKRATITAGKFLTPFGTYNERLTPIWIRNFQDVPIIYPIGTRSTGYSDGAMVRGSLFSVPKVEFNYVAYFSALSTVTQFQSSRTTGFRGSFFFPTQRLEVGGSYQRYLQDSLSNASVSPVPSARDTNNLGVHLWWQPNGAPVQIKSEFSHSPSGYGFWIEGGYRAEFDQSSSWLKRFEPQVRYQQFFRTSLQRGDLLPAQDQQQADFGLNYYLPKSVRLQANYSRQFTPTGDHNIWNFAVTYRFMLPLARRQS